MHRHSHLVRLLLRTSAYCKQILSSLSNTISFFDTSNYIIFRFDSRYNNAENRIPPPLPSLNNSTIASTPVVSSIPTAYNTTRIEISLRRLGIPWKLVRWRTLEEVWTYRCLET